MNSRNSLLTVKTTLSTKADYGMIRDSRLEMYQRLTLLALDACNGSALSLVHVELKSEVCPASFELHMVLTATLVLH